METLLSMQGRQAKFHIGEPSEITTARRAACDLARTLGFNETNTVEVAIVVTEAGTNIHKYTESVLAGRNPMLSPGLAPMYPPLTAAVRYRDFNRGNDEATVLVCRQNKGNKS